MPAIAVRIGYDVSARAARFRNRYRTRIQKKNAVFYAAVRNVRVSVQKDISAFECLNRSRSENMPVCREYRSVSENYRRKVGGNRKIEHHLVNLRIAVAPYRRNAVGKTVQNRYYFFGAVSVGQIVPRPVIKQIAEQNKTVCALFLKCSCKHLAVFCRAVYVRGYKIFHIAFSFRFPPLIYRRSG